MAERALIGFAARGRSLLGLEKKLRAGNWAPLGLVAPESMLCEWLACCTGDRWTIGGVANWGRLQLDSCLWKKRHLEMSHFRVMSTSGICCAGGGGHFLHEFCMNQSKGPTFGWQFRASSPHRLALSGSVHVGQTLACAQLWR